MILIRATLVLLAFSTLAFVLVMVSQTAPTQESWYPKCYSYQAAGIHCPGCGLTRSVYSLLHGQIAQAFAYNPLIALFSPYLLFMWIRSWWFWIWGTQGRSLFPPKAGWPVLIVLLVYWLLRNVPYYPFNLLAPHELSQ